MYLVDIVYTSTTARNGVTVYERKFMLRPSDKVELCATAERRTGNSNSVDDMTLEKLTIIKTTTTTSQPPLGLER